MMSKKWRKIGITFLSIFGTIVLLLSFLYYLMKPPGPPPADNRNETWEYEKTYIPKDLFGISIDSLGESIYNYTNIKKVKHSRDGEIVSSQFGLFYTKDSSQRTYWIDEIEIDKANKIRYLSLSREFISLKESEIDSIIRVFPSIISSYYNKYYYKSKVYRLSKEKHHLDSDKIHFVYIWFVKETMIVLSLIKHEKDGNYTNTESYKGDERKNFTIRIYYCIHAWDEKTQNKIEELFNEIDKLL